MMMQDFSPLLQVSDTHTVSKFLHESVDDMIGKRKMTYQNYNSGDMEWTEKDYDTTKKSIQNLYSKSIIEDNFIIDSHLPVDLHEALKNCFQMRKNEIFQALAKDAVLKNGNNLVENIDWKLKWILGSSDLATLREPLLQLSLHCIRKNSEKNEKNIVPVEVDLNQVDQLIMELSKLKEQ
ncbi:unnamed protein product [Phaedon cochleariae]|uniref:COMM domain-containing protein n=1 Tax=Phaedon cochleariae TaxID=80249 RepID=A0A9N9X256_PHACE|nr:unnamed protein product [Phaedon cochleariae]